MAVRRILIPDFCFLQLLSVIIDFTEMGVRTCVVPGCIDRISYRLRFPHPVRDKMNRFSQWLKAINSPTLNEMDPMEIYRKKVICKKHFRHNCFLSDIYCNKLNHEAIPTEFLPESAKTDLKQEINIPITETQLGDPYSPTKVRCPMLGNVLSPTHSVSTEVGSGVANVDNTPLHDLPSSSRALSFEKSSTNSICDGSMDDSETMYGVNLTKSDNSDLPVQETKAICNQDIQQKNEDQMTANCENIEFQSVYGSLNVDAKNLSVNKMDVISEGLENFQDELPPISFVAVSPFSLRSDHIYDEENAACVLYSELKNPLEENPLNCDGIKVINVKGDKEFQSESDVKIEIKEENDVCESGRVITKNGLFTNALEMNCFAREWKNSWDGVTTTIDDNKFATTDNICAKESTEIVTLIKPQDCDYSKGNFNVGMKDLKIKLESICEVSKCDLKEEKLFETGQDNKAIDDNNDLLTLKEVSESLKCRADGVSFTNFKEDANQGLDVPNLKKMKVEENACVLEESGTRYDTKMGNGQTEPEESFSSKVESFRLSKIRIQLTEKENKSEEVSEGDFDYSPRVFVSSETRLDGNVTSGVDTSVQFSERMDVANCAWKTEQRQVRSRRSSGLKTFLCNICQRSFSRRNNLKKHKLIHSGERFSCCVCKSSFRQKYKLESHMRSHTGEKRFKCDICESSFAWSGNFKVHMLSHATDKPFICDICKLSFTVSNRLRMHMRTHMDEKSFKCNMCDASFSVNYNLKVHMRSHTGERPFHCDICEASFIQKSKLKRHMRTHTV